MNNSDNNKPRTFNPKGVPAPPDTYSQVAVTPLLPHSRLVTLAGLTGCDPARDDNPQTLLEQVRIVYANMQTCLAAAGASPRDIVQVSVLLPGFKKRKRMGGGQSKEPDRRNRRSNTIS